MLTIHMTSSPRVVAAMIKRSSRSGNAPISLLPSYRYASTGAVPPPENKGSTIFTGSDSDSKAIKFGNVVWSEPSPRITSWLKALPAKEFIVKPGYVITGFRIMQGGKDTIDRFEAIYIRPVFPLDLSGPEETITLSAFGGTGGEPPSFDEKATSGYALNSIEVFWWNYVTGLRFRWRNVQDPSKYQEGRYIRWCRPVDCVENTRYACANLAINGRAIPRYVRPPRDYVLPVQTGSGDMYRAVCGGTQITCDYKDDTNAVMFATAFRVEPVDYYSGVVGTITLGYRDFSGIYRIPQNVLLQRMCCLGKGDALMCGPDYNGSTALCDVIISSACSSLTREVAKATPACNCYTSLIKAPVCYDQKCLAPDAYRPAVMLKTFNPCPDLLECNQYLGLPDDVKDSVVNNVKLQQTCVKDTGGGGPGAFPIDDPAPTGGDTQTTTYDTNPNQGKIIAGAAASVLGVLMAGTSLLS